MNIFVLNEDPRQAAIDQCNRHVVKMPTESVQMLCTALHRANPALALPFKPTHANHPCTRWTAQSNENAAWLSTHAKALCCEYTRRYGRRHASEDALDAIVPLLRAADWRDHTAFCVSMPDEWKCSDVVTSYRAFYIAVKSRFARWAPHATAPEWWPFADDGFYARNNATSYIHA